jgi:hypothetical protein
VKNRLEENRVTARESAACYARFDNGRFPDGSHIECSRSITVEEVLAHARAALLR